MACDGRETVYDIFLWLPIYMVWRHCERPRAGGFAKILGRGGVINCWRAANPSGMVGMSDD